MFRFFERDGALYLKDAQGVEHIILKRGESILQKVVDETETSIRVRLRDPGDFTEGTFSTITIDEDQGIQAVIGRLKGEENTTTQSFIFSKEKDWTVARALDWVEEHTGRRISQDSASAEELWAEVKQVNEPEMVVEALASANVVDRQGDLVLPSAFEARLDRFLQNPVILLGHDYQGLPIGKALSVKIVPEGLRVRVQFAPTDEGRKVFRLFKDGYMRGFSIGFIPLEWRQPTAEEVAKHGPELNRVVTKLELLEISAVPVPANQAALAVAAGWGINVRTADDLVAFFKKVQMVKMTQTDEERELVEAAQALHDELAVINLQNIAAGLAHAISGLSHA